MILNAEAGEAQNLGGQDWHPEPVHEMSSPSTIRNLVSNYQPNSDFKILVGLWVKCHEPPLQAEFLQQNTYAILTTAHQNHHSLAQGSMVRSTGSGS